MGDRLVRDLRKQLEAIAKLFGVDIHLLPDNTILVTVYKDTEKTLFTCYTIHPDGEVEETHFSLKAVEEYVSSLQEE
jgi:hypothetical protein